MKHNGITKFFILSFILGFFCIGLTGCNFFNDNQTSVPVNNSSTVVTTEVKKSTVEYETIKVEDLETAIEIAVKKVEPAVIGVTCKKVTTSGKGLSTTTSEVDVSVGSGVIYKVEEIKQDGVVTKYKYYVITNRHVVLGDEDENAIYHLYAYLGNEDIEIIATVEGYDSKVDIALLTFEHTTYIQPVTIADSDELEKGNFVIAVGNPDGYDYYGSATFGIISSPIRYVSTDTDGDSIDDFYASYIQHDVAINPGNSGGGLFNIKGELIGINTLKLVSDDIEGMGFAIPANVVKLIVTEYLEKGKEIIRARLGILGSEVRSLTPYVIENNDSYMEIPDIYEGETQYGIYVSEVNEGTLQGTGIQQHDIILSVGGVKITRTYILNAQLNSLVDFQVGDVVELVYYSRAEEKIKTISVTLKA